MRQLLLLRHAKSGWDDPQMPDHARALTPQGREAARRMRDAMAERDLRVDLVLVSSARRALQTLQALSPFIASAAVEPMDGLYLAPATDILHILRQVTPTKRTTLVIGHNPGLHDFALKIARPGRCEAPGEALLAETYPTAALAQFDVPDEWAGLDIGSARLRAFLTPRDLRG